MAASIDFYDGLGGPSAGCKRSGPVKRSAASNAALRATPPVRASVTDVRISGRSVQSHQCRRPAKTSRALNTGRSTQADDVAIADHGHVGGSVPGGTEGRVHLAGVNENCALWRTATRSPNPDLVDSK